MEVSKIFKNGGWPLWASVRSSKCRQCACVKAGTCSDCLPCRIGTCHNTTRQDGAHVSQLVLTRSTPVDTSPSSQWTQVIPEWPLSALEEPNFIWGDLHGADPLRKMREIYDEVVHCPCRGRNLFQVPSGSAGKAFVAELARLYQAYADRSSLESVARIAFSVAPALVLQKPIHTSKSKDHTIHLQRRLDMWLNGEPCALVNEGKCIQKHLRTGAGWRDDDETIARKFRDLILNGNVRDAMHYLSRKCDGGVLKLDEMIPDTKEGEDTIMRCVQVILKDKPTSHPSCIMYPVRPSNLSIPSCLMT